MNKNLLLLTMWFPYSPGEEFLETELGYLSKAFDKIYVLPTSYLGPRRSSRRYMPDNVELLTAAVTRLQSCYSRAIIRRVLIWFRDPFYRSYVGLDRRQAQTHGVKAVRRLLGFLSTSFFIFQALKHSQQIAQVPLVYSYWLSTGTLAAITLREIGYRSRVVSRAHGGDLYFERHTPPYLPLHGFMVLNVDRLFPVSEHGLRYLRSRYPAAADSVRLSRLGVGKAQALSRPSGGERLHVVSCSSLTPVKRLDLWVRALARCQVPVSWVHIGSGPIETEIRALAARLPPHIQWNLLGEMPNEDVLRYYATHAVDLFVNVSDSEGVPVSIMEALSYGVPVVATAAGGTGELVSEDNGALLPVDASSEEIADTLHRFASLSKADVQRMRTAAIETWEAKANADRQYSDFVALLSQM